MSTHVRVTVPASTANLGPGFDCLGLALGLHNTIELMPDEAAEFEISGEGSDHLPRDAANLVARAASAVFEKTGQAGQRFRFRMTNRIPVAMGLGSSAAAIVGGLVAANAALGGRLSRDELLRMAVGLEGHPDNVAAALYGGLVLVSRWRDELMLRALEAPPWRVAIAAPEMRLSTAAARAALPERVPHADAVFNIGRAALVVKALEQADFDLLGWAMTDRLHQPYRRRLIPGYDQATAAARRAGAAAVALSGAGPALIAFAPEGHEAIARAMAEAFAGVGLAARTFVLPVDRQGVQVSVAG